MKIKFTPKNKTEVYDNKDLEKTYRFEVTGHCELDIKAKNYEEAGVSRSSIVRYEQGISQRGGTFRKNNKSL